MPLFRNRSEAGRALAEQVRTAVSGSPPLILALPRGGVPVAFEVAGALNAELDVFLVRKLGMPGEEELALGAIATGGVRVLNKELIGYMRVPETVVDEVTRREQQELERREQMYRKGRPPAPAAGRTVVLIDDGLATGASMLAASRALRPQGAARIIVAAPVASRQTCQDFRREVDEVICLATPHPFSAVGIWYEDFAQVSDEEVQTLLEKAAQNRLAAGRAQRAHL